MYSIHICMCACVCVCLLCGTKQCWNVTKQIDVAPSWLAAAFLCTSRLTRPVPDRFTLRTIHGRHCLATCYFRGAHLGISRLASCALRCTHRATRMDIQRYVPTPYMIYRASAYLFRWQ